MDRFRMLPSYHYEDNTDGSLLKSVGKPLRDYRIEGNCFQDGVPSPENPIEVQCCGEKTVNMIDYTKIPSRTARGITFTNNNDGTFTANGKLTAVTLRYLLKDGLDLDSFVSGETYYASCGVDYNDGVRRYYLMVQIQNSQTGAMRYYASNGINTTFSLTENESVSVVDVRINSPTGELFEVQDLVFSPIICKASEYVDFEPYGYKVPVTVSNDSGEKTYNIYLNEPLRKVGDCADYIDFKSGKVMRHNVVVDLSGYKWYCQYVNDTENFYYITNAPTPIFSSVYCLCNCAKRTPIGTTNSYLGIEVYESKIIRFRPDMTVYGTLEKWQDYIDNNECYVIYPLGEPQEQPISLPKILTEKGTNIISVGTTLQPSTVNYQYYKGGK